MLKYAGYLALQAGEKRYDGSMGELSADTRRLYEKSLRHYGEVLNGGQADAGVGVNMLLEFERLGNDADAYAVCDRTIGLLPNANLLAACAQSRKNTVSWPKQSICWSRRRLLIRMRR
jgi:hypothetical protein